MQTEIVYLLISAIDAADLVFYVEQRFEDKNMAMSMCQEMKRMTTQLLIESGYEIMQSECYFQ